VRRISLIKTNELYAHLLTHAGAGACRGDLNWLRGTRCEAAGEQL
jgi:hypothetical protein